MTAARTCLTLAALLVVAAIAPAAAAPPEVTLDPPRVHGWWIGDVLTATARITVDEGTVLDPASLPEARPVDYWLDLRAVTLVDAGARGDRHAYTLRFDYQTFYAPLEPKRMTIPPVTISLLAGADRLPVTIPPFDIITAPLREIMAATVPEAMEPDSRLVVIDTRADQLRAGAAALVAILAGLGLAYHRAIGPFARRDRPFAKAAAEVRRALRRGGDGRAMRAAILALHRAFDAALGRRMLAGDVDAFLAARPAYQPVAAEIAPFFDASRALFFGRDPEAAGAVLPPEALAGFAARLAAVERGRP